MCALWRWNNPRKAIDTLAFEDEMEARRNQHKTQAELILDDLLRQCEELAGNAFLYLSSAFIREYTLIKSPKVIDPDKHTRSWPKLLTTNATCNR